MVDEVDRELAGGLRIGGQPEKRDVENQSERKGKDRNPLINKPCRRSRFILDSSVVNILDSFNPFDFTRAAAYLGGGISHPMLSTSENEMGCAVNQRTARSPSVK